MAGFTKTRDAKIVELYRRGFTQVDLVKMAAVSLDEVERIVGRAERRAIRQLERLAHRPRTEGARCYCGAEAVVRCPCGLRVCEDHGIMTVDGPRCEVCMAAA